MNAATVNLLNAIAFPPVQTTGRTDGDPFFTRENDPVAAALAREFGRFALLLILTLAIATGLALTFSHHPLPRAQAPPISVTTAAPANP